MSKKPLSPEVMKLFGFSLIQVKGSPEASFYHNKDTYENWAKAPTPEEFIRRTFDAGVNHGQIEVRVAIRKALSL